MKSFRNHLTLVLSFLACFAGAAKAAVSCEVSASGVAFGVYASIHPQDRDTSGTVSVTCSGTVGDSVNYTLRLNAGTGTFADREVTSSDSLLHYNLYSDVGRSQIWGDGTSGTLIVSDSYSLTESPTMRQYIVYGRIPSGQNTALVGSYNSNITVTLDY